MSKRLARTLLATAAATLVAALGATAALAATTWTVRPGGAVTARFGMVRLTDTRTGALVLCPATIRAALKGGSGLSGTGLGSISAATFGTCTGPLGTQFTLKLTHPPFRLNTASYNSGTGTTTGGVTGIHGTFTGPSCDYVLDGTGAGQDNGAVAVSYVNGTHKLRLLATGGNLHAYRAMGCGFLAGVDNGDRLTLAGTGTVTPAQAITSP
jgi:hypothetical protein